MWFVFPYFNQILAILSATSTSTKITFNNIINHFNYLKNFGTRNLTSSTNQGHLSMQLASIDLFVSPFIWPGFRLAGGKEWADSLHYWKNWLAPHVPSTALPKKYWFCNFHAVFGHFPQITSTHKSTPFGKTCRLSSISVPLPKKLKTYVYH